VSAPASVVSISGLGKVFPKGGVTALENIDLDVRPGEFISLIGPSGCGKSTLLRVIGDLTQPTSGARVVPHFRALDDIGTGAVAVAHGDGAPRSPGRRRRLLVEMLGRHVDADGQAAAPEVGGRQRGPARDVCGGLEHGPTVGRGPNRSVTAD